MNTSEVITDRYALDAYPDRCAFDAYQGYVFNAYPFAGAGSASTAGPAAGTTLAACTCPLRAGGNDVAPNLHNTTEGNSLRFRWNGSYGYRTLYLLSGQQSTNTATVMHVGALHYSPSLHRWLQRDPIDLLGGSPNLYTYCLNSPMRFVDPEGLIVWFLPGTFSGGDVFSSSFIAAVADTLYQTGDLCHVFNWGSGPGDWPLEGNWNREAVKFAEHVQRYYKTQARAGEPLWIVGHSHGGTVALKASQILASMGIPIEGIVCLGMPLTLADKGPNAAPGSTTKAVWLVYEGLDLFFGVAYTFSDRKSGLDRVLAEWEGYTGKCFLRIFNLPHAEYGDWDTHSEYLRSSVWRREIGPIFWEK